MNLNQSQNNFSLRENNLLFSSDDVKSQKENINNNLEKSKEHNEFNNNTENEKISDKKISNLLYLLKQMSDKQLYLLDVISNLQKNSSEQINNLNNRISNLEEKIVKQKEKNKYENSEDEDFGVKISLDEMEPNLILSKIWRRK